MHESQHSEDSVFRALRGGAIPTRSLRLFWSWPKPVRVMNEDTARQAVSTILLEGTPSDWREINFAALAPMVDSLPLFGGAKSLWAEISQEAATLHQNLERVLGPEQRQVLRVAAAVLPAYGFELAGGTALAGAYLGHRRSEDLDFFTPAKEISDALDAFLAACERQGLEVERDPEGVAPTFTRLRVAGVKVDIGRDTPLKVAQSHAVLEGMPVRSLPDLAADKTLALFGRATTRDFVDVYELMRTRYDMSELINLAGQKDSGFDTGWFVKALQQVEMSDPSVVDMLVPLDFDRMKADFLAAAKRLVRKELDKDEPDL